MSGKNYQLLSARSFFIDKSDLWMLGLEPSTLGPAPFFFKEQSDLWMLGLEPSTLGSAPFRSVFAIFFKRTV
jgi:hypothetical protein